MLQQFLSSFERMVVAFEQMAKAQTRIAEALGDDDNVTIEGTLADFITPQVMKDAFEPVMTKIFAPPEQFAEAMTPSVPEARRAKVRAMPIGTSDYDARLMVAVKEQIAKGVTSYSGIAAALNRAGFKALMGGVLYPGNIRTFMLKNGMQSDKTYKGGRKRKDAISFTPTPKPERQVVEIATKEDGKLPFEDMLSARTRQRANIARKERQKTGRFPTADEITAIEKAIAEGRVTKCPPCTDSTGYDHFKGAQS